jgi:hypothetical protein
LGGQDLPSHYDYPLISLTSIIVPLPTDTGVSPI